MAENESNEGKDTLNEAMKYKTIDTTQMFEKGKSAFKYSAAGGSITIRIPWSSIIWAVVVDIFVLIISGILLLIFGGNGFVIIFTGVALGLGAMLGMRLGRWSPIQRDTGEDLNTWIKMKIRDYLANGSYGEGRMSKTVRRSYAVGGPEGLDIECTQWIGTQPLRDIPEPEPGKDYAELRFAPTGHYQVIPDWAYDDGV